MFLMMKEKTEKMILNSVVVITALALLAAIVITFN